MIEEVGLYSTFHDRQPDAKVAVIACLVVVVAEVLRPQDSQLQVPDVAEPPLVVRVTNKAMILQSRWDFEDVVSNVSFEEIA